MRVATVVQIEITKKNYVTNRFEVRITWEL